MSKEAPISVQEGTTAFLEKRKPDYSRFRKARGT